MIYLRNNDKYAEIGLLESPSAGVIVRHPRNGTSFPKAGVHGAYADVGDIVVAIYRYEGDLYLYWNGTSTPWSSIMAMSLARTSSGITTFAVRSGNEERSLTYDAPTLDPPLSAIHEPFVEDEDYDFCLFIKHVYDSPKRSQAVFLPDVQ